MTHEGSAKRRPLSPRGRPRMRMLSVPGSRVLTWPVEPFHETVLREDLARERDLLS